MIGPPTFSKFEIDTVRQRRRAGRARLVAVINAGIEAEVVDYVAHLAGHPAMPTTRAPPA
jgi:hypothetical protein